jgi:hypothetical protein
MRDEPQAAILNFCEQQLGLCDVDGHVMRYRSERPGLARSLVFFNTSAKTARLIIAAKRSLAPGVTVDRMRSRGELRRRREWREHQRATAPSPSSCAGPPGTPATPPGLGLEAPNAPLTAVRTDDPNREWNAVQILEENPRDLARRYLVEFEGYSEPEWVAHDACSRALLAPWRKKQRKEEAEAQRAAAAVGNRRSSRLAQSGASQASSA